MTLDIRGGRKNTAINYSDYVAFEEMLSNAIDSYLIRKSRVSTAPPFLMKIEIKIIDADFLAGNLASKSFVQTTDLALGMTKLRLSLPRIRHIRTNCKSQVLENAKALVAFSSFTTLTGSQLIV